MQITKNDLTQNQQFKFFIAAPFGNYIKHKNAINVRGSFTILRRPGLIKQLFKTLRYDFSKKGWKNQLGLRNPGIKYGLNKYRNNGKEIISIAAIMPRDWGDFAKDIPDHVNLELNLSCPNIDKVEIDYKALTKFYDAFWNNKSCLLYTSDAADE